LHPLTDKFALSQIQEKAKIFARGFLGDADASNLRSGEGGAPGQGEGETTGSQADGAPKTGEV
jgi:hypothetical protein